MGLSSGRAPSEAPRDHSFAISHGDLVVQLVSTARRRVPTHCVCNGFEGLAQGCLGLAWVHKLEPKPKGQAICAEIWRDAQQGGLDLSLNRYRPLVEGRDQFLLDNLRALALEKRQARVTYAFRVVKRFALPITPRAEVDRFLSWMKEKERDYLRPQSPRSSARFARCNQAIRHRGWSR